MGVPSHHRPIAVRGLAGLARLVAPKQVRVRFCATNALPFRVELKLSGRSVVVYGLSPDAAADDAMTSLSRTRRARRPRRLGRPPSSAQNFAEALNEWVESIDSERVRPRMRLVHSA